MFYSIVLITFAGTPPTKALEVTFLLTTEAGTPNSTSIPTNSIFLVEKY